MNGTMNYYNILGISEKATDDEIKKAYRDRIKMWHPDKNTSKDATYMSQKINEAKEILLDRSKRLVFDQELKNERDAAFKSFTNTNRNNKKEASQSRETSEPFTARPYVPVSKWKFFYVWLRFSDASVLRKLLGTIGVLIESLLCLLIRGILLIIKGIAMLITFIGMMIGFLSGGFLCLVLIAILALTGLGAVLNFIQTTDIMQALNYIGDTLYGNFIKAVNDEMIKNIFFVSVGTIGSAFVLVFVMEKLFTSEVYDFLYDGLDNILFNKCITQ